MSKGYVLGLLFPREFRRGKLTLRGAASVPRLHDPENLGTPHNP
jgi:hypothetical protein